MPRYSREIKDRAIALRKQGYSLKQIVAELGIAKSTGSLWIREVMLDSFAQNKIALRSIKAQQRGAITRKLMLQSMYEAIDADVQAELKSYIVNKTTAKLLCAFLYWAEGAKTGSSVQFMNSDPRMILIFLRLFRNSFNLKKEKFAAVLHLHQYHNRKKQLIFWSKTTKIPISKISIYNKPNSGVNIRKGYPGCISINYYDSKILRTIKGFYTFFDFGGVV